jgi:hypothetical protein
MSHRPLRHGLRVPALAAALAAAAAAPAVNLPHEETPARARGASGEARPAPRLLESSLRAPAYRLWEASGFGNERSERAAWVVEDGAAGVRWLAWPNGRRYLRARWEGPVPENVVAIVHTHPAVVDPKPSEQDVETARQLGVPVYAVSRTGIWKAAPDGSVVPVDDGRWWSACRSGACDAVRDPDFRSARGPSGPRNLGPESAYP